MPYRPPPADERRRDLPVESYVFGTIACGLGVLGVWMLSVRMYEYAAGELLATGLLAIATHTFAVRR